MPRSRTRLSRARAIFSRLYRRHTPTPPKHAQFQYDRSPPSTPPTPGTTSSRTTSSHNTSPKSFKIRSRSSLSSVPSPRAITTSLLRQRTARARSDMHLDNTAMQERLAQLEMIESENSSLKLQLDDLQRALDGVQHDHHSRVGQLEMADIENASLRFQLDCLRDEIQRPTFGPLDVAERRLAWLNVDPA